MSESLATSLRFLLLQVRNPTDPIRHQEVQCFAQHLHCDVTQIAVTDLLSSPPSQHLLDQVDVVLLGGSGDYSVAAGGDWLTAALDVMRELYDQNKPTFASCWGFQAMAKALGGKVVTDPSRAELGTIPIQLTTAGRHDPVFGALPSTFLSHAGHQDIVDELPPRATRLAATDLVENQAFTFADRRIYCTQFHPELDRAALLTRLENYPQYVEAIAGMTVEEFRAHCWESPEANTLLVRFVKLAMAA